MKGKSIKVAVIILTLNQREKTLRCLESFRALKSPGFTIVLWDNGSEDGTSDAVRQAFPEVRVVEHPRNLGVASGRNEAAKLAIGEFDPPYLLFLDNDMTVTPDFLDALLAPFENRTSLAQTTGKICELSNASRLYGAGGYKIRFWRGDTKHIGYRETDHGQYDKPRKCYPSGGCMLVRTEVYQKLQGFDPTFDPYGSEDLDFGLRAKKAGYYGLYVPRAKVFHEPVAGFVFNREETSRLLTAQWSKHWLLLMERHAPLWQKLLFPFLSAPYLFLRAAIRSYQNRNPEILKGLWIGFWEFGKSRLQKKAV